MQVQKNPFEAMSHNWRSILLSLSAATLLFASCKRTSSSDNPLPTNYNTSVIIASDNYIVYAIDPVTHSRNWEYTGLHAPVKASPIVYGGMAYLATASAANVTANDTLYKLNSRTGKLVKKIVVDVNNTSNSINILATPIADNGLIYVATSDEISLAGQIFAIDTGTGNAKWHFSADGPIESSPVIYNGKIYFASTLGTVYCLDKANGGTLSDIPFTVTNPVWTLNIPGASFYSSPSVSAPYLYLGSQSDSMMYCIYLDEPTVPAINVGVIRWQFQAHDQIVSSPATYKGRCIFGCTDFNVYCLDTNIAPPLSYTPTVVWKRATNGRVVSSPYVSSDQVVYVGSDDAFLYALNMVDGGIKWRFQASGAVKSSPFVYSGVVYFGSDDKNIYAIDSTRGTFLWNYNLNGLIRCSPVLDNLTGAQVNSQISGYTN